MPLPYTCRALLLLENACFACPDNEALLLAVEVRSGVEPLISTAGGQQAARHDAVWCAARLCVAAWFAAAAAACCGTRSGSG